MRLRCLSMFALTATAFTSGFTSGCATVNAEPAIETRTVTNTEATATTQPPDNYQERLLAQIPEGWIKAVNNKVGELLIAEYFPPDTKEQWEQKLSLESLSGIDLPDPIDFVEGLVSDQSDACNKFSDSTIFSGFENGYPTAVHMLECGSNKRTQNYLLTVIKVIRGNKSLYTITRIWRPSDAKQDDPIEPMSVGAWSNKLREFKVCDPNLAAHPCE